MSDLAREMIEASDNAYAAELSKTETCERCCGQGYHHGFGEGGHSPDWCEACGGAGYVGVATERDAARAALIAALRVVEGRSLVNEHIARVVGNLITQLKAINPPEEE